MEARLRFTIGTGATIRDGNIVDCGNGFVKLINKLSGLAIDISGNGTTNGTPVHQWTDVGVYSQRLNCCLREV